MNAQAANVADALLEALEPFLNIQHNQVAWKIIDKRVGDFEPVNVVVTKGQFLAAIHAVSRANRK